MRLKCTNKYVLLTIIVYNPLVRTVLLNRDKIDCRNKELVCGNSEIIMDRKHITLSVFEYACIRGKDTVLDIKLRDVNWALREGFGQKRTHWCYIC